MPEANDIKGADTPKVDTNAATDVLGKSKIFTPEVINDIHVKAELGAIGCVGSPSSKTISNIRLLFFRYWNGSSKG